MPLATISPPSNSQSPMVQSLAQSQAVIAQALDKQVEVGQQATAAYLAQERAFFTERNRRKADDRAQESLKLREKESDRNFLRALDRDQVGDAFRERTTTISENADSRNEETFQRSLADRDALDAAGLGPVGQAEFNRETGEINRDLAERSADRADSASANAQRSSEKNAELTNRKLEALDEEKDQQAAKNELALRGLEDLAKIDITQLSDEDLAGYSSVFGASQNPRALAEKARIDTLIAKRQASSKTTSDTSEVGKKVQSLNRAKDEIAGIEASIAALPEGESPTAKTTERLVTLKRAAERLTAEVKKLNGEPFQSSNDVETELLEDLE